MQLVMATGYALRCMPYLSGKERLFGSPEIGEAVGISKILVQKALHILRDAGVVSSTHGGTGGYRLAKKPEEAVLFDIIPLPEKTMKANRCLESERYCGRYETRPMHAYHKEVQETLEDCFGRDTLQDVIGHGGRKRKKVVHSAKER